MERLLLLTGSGNDTIVNPVSTFHGGDELHTGDGNDTVNAGPGNDYVDLGPGDDVVTVVGVYAFATDVSDEQIQPRHLDGPGQWVELVVFDFDARSERGLQAAGVGLRDGTPADGIQNASGSRP